MKICGSLIVLAALLEGATAQPRMAIAPIGSSKLDPALEQMLMLRSDPRHAHLARRLDPRPLSGATGGGERLSENEDMVPIIVSGDVHREDVVRAVNGIIGSRHGAILTAEVPADSLRPLAARPGIVAVEASRQLHPSLLHSVPSTGAHVMHAQSDPVRRLTGKGVIIGFTDSGINTPHATFRAADGRTRILSVWDQHGTGTPPSGWSYGAEHDSAEINGSRWWMYDLAEHGTHVAGIAAGNGRPGGTYTGMAPEADIIMVCNRGDDLWSGGLTTVGTLDGYDYIRSRANALGKRHVINTSQGTNLGPHDGTSLFEQAIDADIRAGSVVCLAAGNDALSGRHASAVVPSGGAVEIRFSFHTLFPQDTAAIPMEAWYSGGDRISVSCRKEADPSFAPSVPPGSSGLLTFDSVEVVFTNMVHSPLNGDNVIRCTLLPMVPVTEGDIVMVLRFEAADNGSLPDGGRIDLWWERNFEVAFLDHRDDACTIGMPGGARGAITVGSCDNDAGTAGALSVFSAHGPARDGALKPDIVAPGGGVTSSVPGGGFRSMSGTSMAAPHAAGAAALLLEHEPGLTTAQVKERLLAAAVADVSTGLVPNAQWGYGRLSAWRAIHGELPQPRSPFFMSVRQAGSSAILQWTDPPEDPVRTLQHVFVYRDGVRIDSVVPGIGSFLDRAAGVGRHVYWLVASWSDGWLSAPGDAASVEIFLAFHPWLLVDDDAGMPFESYFVDALDSAGGTCDVWHTIAAGPVTKEVLLQYLGNDGGVMWCCGSDYTSALTQAEQAALAAYLDAGGRLFISGQDIGYGLTVRGGESDRQFYASYLRAELALDGSGIFALSGVDDGPLHGMHFRIAGGDGADDQLFPSAVNPLPPAVSLLAYDGTVPDPEQASRALKMDPSRPQMRAAAGTALIGAIAYRWNGCRVVYCSFGFEAIDNAPARAAVMRAIVGSLTVRDTLCHALVRQGGWTMASVPVVSGSMRPADLFASPVPAIYGFDGAYRPLDTLRCGEGFWLHDALPRTDLICGDTAGTHDVPLKAGWNLIAPYHISVSVDAATTTPAGIIESPFFAYDRRYLVAGVLTPGQAYWVRAGREGVLHLR